MSISNQLTTLTDEHVMDICAKYVDKWGFSLEWESLLDNLQRLFDVNYLTAVRERFVITNEAVIKLGCEMTKRNLMNTKDDIDVLIKYNNLLEKIHYTELMVNHYLHYKKTCNEGYDFNINIDTTMFKFTPLNYEDMQPFQKLIFRLLDIFQTKNYRKRDDVVYEEIYVGAHGTHAWKKKCTILEFVH